MTTPATPRQQAYQRDSANIHQAWKSIGSPSLRTICEVAVGPWSLLSRFEGLSQRALFVEPDPQMAAEAAINFPWAEILRVAVAASVGTANLRKLKGASYIKGIPWAPMFAKSQEKCRAAGKVTVPTMPFNMIDDGQIDVLNLDCEGSEWFVISNMSSRPLLIQIELYPANNWHRELVAWFAENGYVEIKRWGRSNIIYRRA